MSMRVSLIIPTRNSARTLAACLESCRNQTHDDVEVIVVDNSSTDGTVEIATERADLVLDQKPERSAQRNRGAAESSGDVVVFIDSDMVLEPTVVADVVAVFDDRPEVGSVVIPERSFGDGFFASCRVLEKSLYVGDSDVEAPRAFRREVFEATGGWDETLTAAEDWDLADRTKALGTVVDRVDSLIWHDEGRIQLRVTYSKKQYYGRWVAEYLNRHPEGRAHLARSGVFKHAGTLARHPVKTSGLVVLKSVEAAGLLRGMRKAA
jgi:glycosyltransferase involved in cell wall biosynthesis